MYIIHIALLNLKKGMIEEYKLVFILFLKNQFYLLKVSSWQCKIIYILKIIILNIFNLKKGFYNNHV